jgi:hypothetical protein
MKIDINIMQIFAKNSNSGGIIDPCNLSPVIFKGVLQEPPEYNGDQK